MLKIVASVMVAGMIPLLAATVSSGCTSTSASFQTDCTNYTPDAGNGDNVTCSIGWSCNSAQSLFQMVCTQDERPEYYDCSCSNGITTIQSFVVDSFICDPPGALPTANMGCDFNIQQ